MGIPMTITELRDTLSELVAQGHGNVPVYTYDYSEDYAPPYPISAATTLFMVTAVKDCRFSADIAIETSSPNVLLLAYHPDRGY